MKIGILTFHRAINYGAVLQCYALQEILKEMGHEVYVIDYRQQMIEKGYKYWHWDWFFKKIFFPTRLVTYIRNYYKFNLKINKFKSFRNKFLNIKDKCYYYNIPSNYDRYIIGSDQLLTLPITGGLDNIYSANFKVNKSSRKIGYAISTTKKSISTIGKESWLKILSNFNAFSFREKTYTDMLLEMTNIEVNTCVDPTLLTNSNIWEAVSRNAKIKKDCIVLYEVRHIKGHEHDLKNKADALANKEKVPIIDLSKGNYSIEDWLAYIKYARCIITSSFHATAFALIFNRPLYAFRLNDGLDDRYVNLLEAINESNCILSLDDTPLNIPNVDTSKRTSKLNSLKRPSLDYLKNSIK